MYVVVIILNALLMELNSISINSIVIISLPIVVRSQFVIIILLVSFNIASLFIKYSF